MIEGIRNVKSIEELIQVLNNAEETHRVIQGSMTIAEISKENNLVHTTLNINIQKQEKISGVESVKSQLLEGVNK